MRVRRWNLLIATGALLTVPGAVSGATFTVSSGGSISSTLAAASSGDSVLVEEGTYFENVALKNGVTLLGGYDATFTSRDPDVYRTMIHGGDVASTITSGPSVSASTLVDGFVVAGAGSDGSAGVKVNGGAPVFSNNEITGNRRGLAGGVYIFGGSAATFRDNFIHDNSSAGSGGGIRVERSPAILVNNEIADCVAPNSGGGLYVFKSAVYCSANSVSGCYVGEGGGGIYLQEVSSAARFVDNSYTNCRAEFGGGVHAKNATFVTMERETFTSCAANRSGGGVAVTNSAQLTLIDCALESCTATDYGGGAWTYGSTLSLLGAGATLDPSPARVVNCSAGFGGGVMMDTAIGTIDNVRFTGCTTPDYGGGLYALHTASTVQECVFEFCVAGEGGGAAFRSMDSPRHRRSSLLSCTIYGCSSTGTSQQPPYGGGLTMAATGNNDNPCTCQGNIVAGTLAGPAVRCRTGGTGTAGRPVINCSSFHCDPSNPIAPEDVVFGNRCDDAFNLDPIRNRTGVDPDFCVPIVNYQLQQGSQEVGSSCVVGKLDRGAYPDGVHCSGTITSLTTMTWGQLKAAYR